MSKVVLVSGSPREEGNTALLIGECAKVLEEEGLETQVFSFADMSIASCLACGECARLSVCRQEDDLNEIIKALRGARGFIVGSPVYFGTARGELMSALQRIGMVNKSTDEFLSRMVGGPIVVARRGGHTATLQEMLMFFFINEMIVPGSNYWNIVFGKRPGEAMEDDEGVETIRRFAANVAWLINKLG